MLFLVAFLSAGCTKHFKAPASARLVGGGASIHFEAPANGTLFLVDDRELLSSKSMRKGESFVADGAVDSPNHGKHKLGRETRVYFEPEDSSQLIEIDQWSEKPQDR